MRQIHASQDALEKACQRHGDESSRHVHFEDIFPGGNSDSKFREEALKFVNREAPFDDRRSLELAASFRKNFNRLANHMEGRATKKLMENAKTHTFPRRSLLPNSLNLAILYSTGILYAASRLAILALALASLRSMPDGVYVTTWTANIPSLH